MANRSGTADLPLHGGRVPPWLATRMADLGALITNAIVIEYGRDEFLRRLANPFWFQSFGAVMGMDWHSSGITTSVLGALKRGLQPQQKELGIYVCGGRGKHSRRTPDELALVGQQTGIDGTALARSSRLIAKVDSAAVQDGFDLYLHGFIVTTDGNYVVVQQGMSDARGEARRYHWLSEGVENFLDDPHAAIDGENQGQIINLVDRRADPSRKTQMMMLGEGSPDKIIQALYELKAENSSPVPQLDLPHLVMPHHHDVRASDVIGRRLYGNICAAIEGAPKDFSELLLTPKVGARTVEALALVAEVVHGAPSRFSDPARFSFAHGGKDRHPFPVPIKVYDRTISVLKSAVEKSRLGDSERMDALKRLDKQSRILERNQDERFIGQKIDSEKGTSHSLGGRSVFGWETHFTGRDKPGG